MKFTREYFFQFALLENTSVDDDLAQLKKEIAGSVPVLSCSFFFYLSAACQLGSYSVSTSFLNDSLYFLLCRKENFRLAGHSHSGMLSLRRSLMN